MKTIKTLLATIALLLCSETMNAHDFEVDGIYYNILSENNKTVEVTFEGDTYSSKANEYTDSVTIPQKVDYEGNEYAVTGIGTEAFRACFKLLSVNIPDGVVTIRERAFYECRKLSFVVIPEGVTSIGSSAFSGCTSLASVVIPEGVTSIGASAFKDCTSLASVVIPEGVTRIGESAFSGCRSLTSVKSLSSEEPKIRTDLPYATFAYISANAILYIPEGASYPKWESYFSRVEYLSEEEITGIEDVMPEVRKSVIYDINGFRVKDPVKGGIYIIDGEKVKL